MLWGGGWNKKGRHSMTTSKDIPGYEGLYTVTTIGQIYSLISKRFRKLGLDRYGYPQIDLYKDGQRKQWKVHRLVLLAFVGESYLTVNHINGIKTDNRLENLEYCTVAENNRHAKECNLHISPKGRNHHMYGRRGDRCPNAKLSNSQKREIKVQYLAGGISQRALAKLYGVSQTPILDAIHGDY